MMEKFCVEKVIKINTKKYFLCKITVPGRGFVMQNLSLLWLYTRAFFVATLFGTKCVPGSQHGAENFGGYAKKIFK